MSSACTNYGSRLIRVDDRDKQSSKFETIAPFGFEMYEVPMQGVRQILGIEILERIFSYASIGSKAYMSLCSKQFRQVERSYVSWENDFDEVCARTHIVVALFVFKSRTSIADLRRRPYLDDDGIPWFYRRG